MAISIFPVNEEEDKTVEEEEEVQEEENKNEKREGGGWGGGGGRDQSYNAVFSSNAAHLFSWAKAIVSLH